MKPTPRITAELIRDLASTTGPCLTVVVGGDLAGENAIQLKHAMQAARAECASRGVDPEPFLEPVESALRDLQSDTPHGQIALFRSPTTMLALPATGLKPTAVTGDRFDIRSLLSLAATQKSFYILALSQNRTRLLKCTENSSEEVLLEGAVVNLHEFLQTRKPDHVLDNRASAGPSMGSGGGVMFGTSSDLDSKDEYMTHFLVQLDRAVGNTLRGERDPLVVVGVEHEIAMYQRLNHYPNFCEPGVHGAPDGLDGGEMHRRALELLDERLAEAGREIPADFDKKVGTGHASTHVQEIVDAAFQGRVSHLFFQDDASYTGTYDKVRRRVKHTDDPLDAPEDLIDAAAFQTILHAGEARIRRGSALPNGVPVCALFRYPAATAQPQAGEMESVA
ncbi:MAG: hypothetical protein JWN34_4309 [Bryobacterales bacterium]|nr:hypothetical protein [Bryobacterales bacterium]